MANPEALGASPRYLEIDLAVTVPPFYFAPLFAAQFPEDQTFAAQAVSRTIVAVAGSGTLTVRDTTNKTAALTFAAGEANAIQAVGIAATAGVTRIKVLL